MPIEPLPATAVFGTIPQSDALAEASPDSLNDLFSRDPEHFTDQDICSVIFELRQQRSRWAAAEAAGTKTPRAPKAATAKVNLSLSAPELDL